MYYGEEMNFTIESEAGCGTIVSLEIPLEAKYDEVSCDGCRR